MKKLLILSVAITFFSCNNTDPTRTSSDFNYEGNEVSFITQDTLITDGTIKKIKNHILLEAKYTCKYPESFIPNNLMIIRVDSTGFEGLKEFIEGDVAFLSYIYFKAKNSFGMAGSESLSLYYSENGDYAGKLPTFDLD